MAVYTVSGNQLSISVKSLGAELTGLRGTDGTEYLWQPDPAVWDAQSPVLFPIIGQLADGRYELDGQFYEMSWHGFAGKTEFELVNQTAGELVFRMKSSPSTRREYPFEFELDVSYRLEGLRLKVGFSVRNCGLKEMPFSIGAHPGFNLPAPHEECFLEFEQAEVLDARLLGKDLLMSDQSMRILNGGKAVPLSRTLFDRGALTLMNFKSDTISLCCRSSSRRVTVEFAGFPYVGLWANPAAPYICIEPWFGYTDPENPYGSFRNKPGIQTLPPGGDFQCGYAIVITSAAEHGL